MQNQNNTPSFPYANNIDQGSTANNVPQNPVSFARQNVFGNIDYVPRYEYNSGFQQMFPWHPLLHAPQVLSSNISYPAPYPGALAIGWPVNYPMPHLPTIPMPFGYTFAHVPQFVEPFMPGALRPTIVSTVHHTVGLVNRNGILQYEDVMFIDHQLVYDVPAVQYMHPYMQLNIDNFSYEQLLSLQRSVGTVNVGLDEATIDAHLKRQKHESESSDDDEMCCICQEGFVNGEDLGRVDCVHHYHFDCIKQWLLEKNLCPLCKREALAIGRT